MKTVAAYAFESNGFEAGLRFNEAIEETKSWLIRKKWNSELNGQFINDQGNKTEVTWVDLDPPQGKMSKITLIEDLTDSRFSTEISIAVRDSKCAVFVELRVEGVGGGLQPFRFDARRPRFVGRLLSGNLNWHLGETPLTDRVYEFRGAVSGRNALEVIWHPDRVVPFVLISLGPTPKVADSFSKKLAGDLAGLAIVATVDEDASWEITRGKGAEWSCYNGALRIYWPFGAKSSKPKLHPIWLRKSIFSDETDPESGSYRMRMQLRRLILGVSALSIREPFLIRELVRSAREKRINELQKALEEGASDADYQAIAESYAKENDNLRKEIKEREERISLLEGHVSELQLALRYLPHDVAEILPDDDVEPETVEEAVAIAKTRFSNRLIFSDSISDGVHGLNPVAGPPEKILRYLQKLSELAEAREVGPLGKGVVAWLDENGVSCSIESETVRKSGGRQWSFDGKQVTFDFHLKPSDGVSPDKCVRIYFDLADTGKVRVGWIGRHPD